MNTLISFLASFVLLTGTASFAETAKREVYTTKAYSIASNSGFFLFFIKKGDKLTLKSCDQENCILESKGQSFSVKRMDLRLVKQTADVKTTSKSKVRGSRSRSESVLEKGAAEPSPPIATVAPTRRRAVPSNLKNEDLNFGAATCSCARGTCGITSNFGPRSRPNSRATSNHAGLDIGGGAGTPIVASESGRISFAGNKGGYGKTIDITHTSTYMTRYGHMSRLKKTSGWVQKGEVIGYMGSTGNVTGPHLHFEIHRNGKQVNPTQYVSTKKTDISKRCETVLAIGATSSGNKNAGSVR